MYRVLIVEDDPMVAMINEQYTKRNKNFCIVGKCRDGEGALAFLEKKKADLLILDVNMPKMDGFETLRQIRSRKIGADVILATAANHREAFEEGLRLGIVDYLIKPFSYDRFQMALEKYAERNAALKDMDTLNQKKIDCLMEHFQKKNERLFPKGIQEKTLQFLLEYLRENKGVWFTGEEISEKIGLTGVTVRRYMHYLAESGRVIGEMNYETGGRPCMRYQVEEAARIH